MPVDPTGVIFAVGFVALALSAIPFDRWRERRRIQRRRQQAHRRLIRR